MCHGQRCVLLDFLVLLATMPEIVPKKAPNFCEKNHKRWGLILFHSAVAIAPLVGRYFFTLLKYTRKMSRIGISHLLGDLADA